MNAHLKTNEASRKRTRGILFLVFVMLLAIAILAGFRIYQRLMRPNVSVPQEGFSLYIPTDAGFQQVKDSLFLHHVIDDEGSFEWVAAKKDYPAHVRPGHYLVKDGMSNFQLVNMLRGGMQTPVKVTFNNVRDIRQLAGKIGAQIEADSAAIVEYLLHSDSIGAWGFSQRTLPALFLPNTYEFYWNTDAEKFTVKMKHEYDKFWNETRRNKAQALHLSPVEVSTLASIVDKETNKTDEMARIAGVYLNRLRSGWLLQADPTLVFAVGDFEMKRVLNVHKEIESPYNTYKYIGLPPGPICIPSLASINAVLDAEKHNFYYFCAKEDFSGYHVFAKTLTEHNRNAQRYHRALEMRN